MIRKKPLNLLPVTPTRLVATAQPVGQLLWVTAHFGPELLQGQAVDLPEPGQFFHQIFGAGDRVVAEEFDDFRHATQRDRGPVIFPVPDGGGSHANLCRDIFLVQSKLKTAAAQVIAEGDRLFGMLLRYLYFRGNLDLMGLL